MREVDPDLFHIADERQPYSYAGLETAQSLSFRLDDPSFDSESFFDAHIEYNVDEFFSIITDVSPHALLEDAIISANDIAALDAEPFHDISTSNSDSAIAPRREQSESSLEEARDMPQSEEVGNRHVLKVSFDEVRALVAALPRAQQLALAEEFGVSSEPAPKPDISHIPLWGGKDKDGPAIAWLEAHYGAYLATFSAPENRIYRQDVENHDAKLARGIGREAYAQGKKPREFLPIKANETTDRAKRWGLDKDGKPLSSEAEETLRIAASLRNRKYQQRKNCEDPSASAA